MADLTCLRYTVIPNHANKDIPSAKQLSSSERCPLGRGSLACIHSTGYQEFVVSLEGCPI